MIDLPWERLLAATVALVTESIWLAVLVETRADELVEDVWRVKLVQRCGVQNHVSIITVALACPGVGHIKVWPLPVEQPWRETPDPLPDPWPGWYAKR